MRVVRGVVRFLADFVVGDDWTIAAGVAAVLVGAGALLDAGVGDAAISIVTAAAVASVFAASVVRRARR